MASLASGRVSELASEPSESSEVPAQRRRVVRDCVGVGVAVGAYGVAFGAASVAAGLSVLQTSLLSLLAFTGGTQFAVVGVLGAGGSAVSAVAGGLLLGARNTLYALRLAPLLQVRGPRRLIAALGTIDESTAMSLAQRTPPLRRTAFWWTAGAVYLFWNLTTVLGAAGAGVLGDPARFGLDAVIPAAFLALLSPRLREGRIERRVAVAAGVIAAALIPVSPPGVPVLAASAALLLGGVRR